MLDEDEISYLMDRAQSLEAELASNGNYGNAAYGTAVGMAVALEAVLEAETTSATVYTMLDSMYMALERN